MEGSAVQRQARAQFGPFLVYFEAGEALISAKQKRAIGLIHNIFIYEMSSPSKLFSCVQAQAILQSPTNNSSAKNHWSFNKDSRFKRSKYYCDSFYRIPGIKQNQNRKAAFGYGQQNDLEFDQHPHQVNPSPDTYNLNTFVQTNKMHQKGFTPNMSRDEIAPMSYIQLGPQKVPGPGRYDQYRYNQTPKWSLHKRVSEQIFPQTTVKIVPGPGTYVNQEALDKRPNGHYHLSNHKSTKAKVFNPPCSKRFYKSTTDVPGPGVYQPKNDISNEGKYVLSKCVAAGQRKFMEGRRLSFTELSARRSFTPGPGSYRSPSQFGQYDEKKNMRASTSHLAERVKNGSSNTDRTRHSNNMNMSQEA